MQTLRLLEGLHDDHSRGMGEEEAEDDGGEGSARDAGDVAPAVDAIGRSGEADGPNMVSVVQGVWDESILPPVRPEARPDEARPEVGDRAVVRGDAAQASVTVEDVRTPDVAA